MEDLGGTRRLVHCWNHDSFGRPQAIGPDLLELADVRGVDLSQRRVSCAGKIAIVGGPIRIRVTRGRFAGPLRKADRGEQL